MSLHWPWALTALLAFPLLLAVRWCQRNLKMTPMPAPKQRNS